MLDILVTVGVSRSDKPTSEKSSVKCIRNATVASRLDRYKLSISAICLIEELYLGNIMQCRESCTCTPYTSFPPLPALPAASLTLRKLVLVAATAGCRELVLVAATAKCREPLVATAAGCKELVLAAAAWCRELVLAVAAAAAGYT